MHDATSGTAHPPPLHSCAASQFLTSKILWYGCKPGNRPRLAVLRERQPEVAMPSSAAGRGWASAAVYAPCCFGFAKDEALMNTQGRSAITTAHGWRNGRMNVLPEGCCRRGTPAVRAAAVGGRNWETPTLSASFASRRGLFLPPTIFWGRCRLCRRPACCLGGPRPGQLLLAGASG